MTRLMLVQPIGPSNTKSPKFLKMVVSRDVKTVYFSKPVNGLPKPVFYRLPVTERLIVGGIIVTGRSALAISRSLVDSRRPWLAYQTHGRRRSETKDSGVSKR